MADIQLTRIEEKLDGVVAGQATLGARMATVEGKLDGVVAGQAALETRIAKVEVTVEVMRDDIKQIAEGHAVTQVAIARSAEASAAHIDRKIEPIERAVRALFGSRS